MEQLLTEIPRHYTGIAEWGSCLLFVLLLRHRFSRGKMIGISTGALVLQIAFLVLTGDVPLAFWIPCMAFAVMLMYVYIYSVCDIRRVDAVYFGIQAFVVAEFMASLHWQIIGFSWMMNVVAPVWAEWIFLLAIYGGIWSALWGLLHKHVPKDGRMHIRRQECISALIIGIAVFTIGNVSFLSIQTPFSGRYAFDIVNIRTLVNLGGVAMLYAHMVQ